MQSPQTIHTPALIPILARRAVQYLRSQSLSEIAVLIGLPLLIVVGTVLGVINLLSMIHLVSVLING